MLNPCQGAGLGKAVVPGCPCEDEDGEAPARGAAETRGTQQLLCTPMGSNQPTNQISLS